MVSEIVLLALGLPSKSGEKEGPFSSESHHTVSDSQRDQESQGGGKPGRLLVLALL
jgi:hypothetical protein